MNGKMQCKKSLLQSLLFSLAVLCACYQEETSNPYYSLNSRTAGSISPSVYGLRMKVHIEHEDEDGKHSPPQAQVIQLAPGVTIISPDRENGAKILASLRNNPEGAERHDISTVHQSGSPIQGPLFSFVNPNAKVFAPRVQAQNAARAREDAKKTNIYFKEVVAFPKEDRDGPSGMYKQADDFLRHSQATRALARHILNQHSVIQSLEEQKRAQEVHNASQKTPMEVDSAAEPHRERQKSNGPYRKRPRSSSATEEQDPSYLQMLRTEGREKLAKLGILPNNRSRLQIPPSQKPKNAGPQNENPNLLYPGLAVTKPSPKRILKDRTTASSSKDLLHPNSRPSVSNNSMDTSSVQYSDMEVFDDPFMQKGTDAERTAANSSDTASNVAASSPAAIALECDESIEDFKDLP